MLINLLIRFLKYVYMPTYFPELAPKHSQPWGVFVGNKIMVIIDIVIWILWWYHGSNQRRVDRSQFELENKKTENQG